MIKITNFKEFSMKVTKQKKRKAPMMNMQQEKNTGRIYMICSFATLYLQCPLFNQKAAYIQRNRKVCLVHREKKQSIKTHLGSLDIRLIKK